VNKTQRRAAQSAVGKTFSKREKLAPPEAAAAVLICRQADGCWQKTGKNKIASVVKSGKDGKSVKRRKKERGEHHVFICIALRVVHEY